jgi:hypothetical protein
VRVIRSVTKDKVGTTALAARKRKDVGGSCLAMALSSNDLNILILQYLMESGDTPVSDGSVPLSPTSIEA